MNPCWQPLHILPDRTLTRFEQRPFEANSHSHLAEKIVKGEPKYPTTNPPVSQPCLHAISSLLEKDRRKRIGAISFESFTDNPFFRPIDFEALERKEIEPVFTPSADKTNFDATYDLEELLLEEAPLEARARRQKPREKLKDDATDEEVRVEKLHEMIETMFQPFNYTTSAEKPNLSVSTSGGHTTDSPTEYTNTITTDSRSTAQTSPISYKPAKTPSYSKHLPRNRDGGDDSPSRGTPVHTRSSTQSPSGSPPFSTAAPIQQAVTSHPPSSDPHALPIQTYDNRNELFSTSSDLELKWERERDRDRQREERERDRDRERHRGHSTSPPPQPRSQPPTSMPGHHGRYAKPSALREWDYDSQRAARAYQREMDDMPDYHAYIIPGPEKSETKSLRVTESRRTQQQHHQHHHQQPQQDQSHAPGRPTHPKSLGRSFDQKQAMLDDTAENCWPDPTERTRGAVRPAQHTRSSSANAQSDRHGHHAQTPSVATTALPTVTTNVEAAYGPNLDERIDRPTGMVAAVERAAKTGMERRRRRVKRGRRECWARKERGWLWTKADIGNEYLEHLTNHKDRPADEWIIRNGEMLRPQPAK